MSIPSPITLIKLNPPHRGYRTLSTVIERSLGPPCQDFIICCRSIFRGAAAAEEVARLGVSTERDMDTHAPPEDY